MHTSTYASTYTHKHTDRAKMRDGLMHQPPYAHTHTHTWKQKWKLHTTAEVCRETNRWQQAMHFPLQRMADVARAQAWTARMKSVLKIVPLTRTVHNTAYCIWGKLCYATTPATNSSDMLTQLHSKQTCRVSKNRKHRGDHQKCF